jgi:NAD(P)-dependent dehydrogenase (short-subunit alcohol dehydrogenase family)
MPSTNGVLVVTGGSRGIGAATALLAAGRGYAVIVNYASDVAAAEQVVAAIHAKGREAVAVRGDVSKPEDVEHIFAAADRLGTVSGLVNNAGFGGPPQTLGGITPERIASTFAVNVTGSFLCAAAAVKRMSTKAGGEGGAIVNITSAAARIGGANMYLDYAASKGAIDTFTVGLALEVAAEGIRVNGVRPGVIDTDFHSKSGDPDRARRMSAVVPMARPGTAEEVANAIVWLLSAEASYVTGSILDVTGGRGVFG